MQIADYQLTVYAITDRTWLKPGQTLASQVEQAILGGATIIQLREKKATPEEFLALAREVKVITDQYGVPLIINDNPETAVAVDAAGVHIGQSDGEAEKVRAVIGPNRILGVSARTVEQAKNAELAGADYLGCGAVFGTTTKTDAESITKETLKDVCNAVNIPVVAIGGVNADNMMELQGTGIAGVAVISAIFAQKDVRKAAETIRKNMDCLLGKQ